jgi:hypothetical protein
LETVEASSASVDATRSGDVGGEDFSEVGLQIEDRSWAANRNVGGIVFLELPDVVRLEREATATTAEGLSLMVVDQMQFSHDQSCRVMWAVVPTPLPKDSSRP